MHNTESKVIDIITENFWLFIIAISLIGGIAARLSGMYLVSSDYYQYLQPWMETLHNYGGFRGLAIDFSNYYIPYLCILAAGSGLEASGWLIYIKVISMISEVAFAAAAALLAHRLLKQAGQDPRWASAVFAIFMFSPMVVLDGAFWGQCDYIYAVFCILCIYFLLGKRYYAAMNMFGIAFIFKQQALFILPVLVLVWFINKSFSAKGFLLIPLWYLIGGLPAIIAGRPAHEVYSIYFQQANVYNRLTMNLPNLYVFFPNQKKDIFFLWGIMATAAIFMILALWLIIAKYKLTDRAIVALCICSTGICNMFLPALHERYLVLYVAFTYLYCCIYQKKKLFIPGILDLLVCITYFYFLYGVDLTNLYPLIAAIHMTILSYMICDTTRIIRQGA